MKIEARALRGGVGQVSDRKCLVYTDIIRARPSDLEFNLRWPSSDRESRGQGPRGAREAVLGWRLEAVRRWRRLALLLPRPESAS